MNWNVAREITKALKNFKSKKKTVNEWGNMSKLYVEWNNYNAHHETAVQHSEDMKCWNLDKY